MVGDRMSASAGSLEGIDVNTNPGAGTGFVEKVLSEARGLCIPYKQATLLDEICYDIFELLERVAKGEPTQADIEMLPLTRVKTLSPKLDHYEVRKILSQGGRSACAVISVPGSANPAE